jgi:hypothetical protein
MVVMAPLFGKRAARSVWPGINRTTIRLNVILTPPVVKYTTGNKITARRIANSRSCRLFTFIYVQVWNDVII